MGLGISSIALSSLGDREKGYPKRQALWEKTKPCERFALVVWATEYLKGLSHKLPQFAPASSPSLRSPAPQAQDTILEISDQRSHAYDPKPKFSSESAKAEVPS